MLPAPVWVLAGAALTLLGVWQTNRGNTRRLREQLQHDADQRRIDREQGIRKEIYLDAAEAISTGLTSIPAFANLDISDPEIMARYIDRAPAVAKVHVIANVRTAAAVERLTREIAAAAARLLIKRLPVKFAKSALTSVENALATFEKERGRWVEMMRQENLAGRDENRWKWITHNFEFEQGRVKQATSERDKLRPELIRKHLDLLEECVRESVALQEFLVPALLAIRDELGFAADEPEMRRVFAEGAAGNAATLKKLAEELRALGAP